LNSKSNEINIMNYKIQNLEDQLKIITEKLSNSNKEIDELKQIELNYFNQIKDLESEIDFLES
jgi:predicted  nucleic acid-binding Zn-ribbon protein